MYRSTADATTTAPNAPSSQRKLIVGGGSVAGAAALRYGRSRLGCDCRLLSKGQLVGGFKRCSAHPADYGRAVPAHQWITHRPRATRTPQRGALRRVLLFTAIRRIFRHLLPTCGWVQFGCPIHRVISSRWMGSR